MDDACITCKWIKRTDDDTWVCTYDSPDGDEVEINDYCGAWEEKE